MTHRLGYAAAQNWRMRARETRAIAEEMKEIERKELCFRLPPYTKSLPSGKKKLNAVLAKNVRE
jgi:hypothetical protein